MAPPLLPTSVYVSAGEPDPGPRLRADEQSRAGRRWRRRWRRSRGRARGGQFASGQAASMALMLALAAGRERIVLPADGYYNTRALAAGSGRTGPAAVAVDLLDLGRGRAGAAPRARRCCGPRRRPTRCCASPTWRRSAALAAAAGAPLVVDNTVATGLLQRPLDFGAVASVYSLTKSAVRALRRARRRGGHQGRRRCWRTVRGWRTAGGGIPGPFESWLVLRGLKTLPLRIERAVGERAARSRRFLAGHPRVTRGALPGARAAVARGGAAGRCRAASGRCCRSRSPGRRPTRTPSWRRPG